MSKRINPNGIGILAFCLLATLFLEADAYVMFSPIGRLRPNLIVIMFIAITSLLIIIVSLKNKVWMVSKPLLYLILYLGVNIISFIFVDFNNPLRFEYGLKVIIFLLLS